MSPVSAEELVAALMERGITSPEQLLKELELKLHGDRTANGRWCYVTFNPDDDEPINASGIYPTEEEAFLAMMDEAREYERVFDEELPRKVIPIFPARKGAGGG